MHTLVVVAFGLLLLCACLFAGHALAGGAGSARAALVFLPLWLAGAAINMYLGVRGAGYSAAEEAPIFVVVFAVPAIVALLVWWRWR